ncbi:hypothetical protein FKP32DRAFT_1674166 [Trametes sanguinea]|nr:hypothetical protein FKP32DRAFT_1674166 [Trametes sanguinea]
MSAPTSPTPTCSIFVHPPTSPTIEDSPRAPHYDTFASLAEACGTRSPSLSAPEPGSPVPVQGAFRPLTIPFDRYLLPPNWRLRKQAKQYKAEKKASRLRATRGRSLPDPWKLIYDPATEQLMLVAVQAPGSLLPSTAQPPSGPADKSFLDRARLVPIYETAIYVAFLYVHLRYILLPLFF